MLQEISNTVLKEAKKSIVVDSIQFVESKKFNTIGFDKSLYLVFAAYNKSLDCYQQITYDVCSKGLEFNLHYHKI